MKLLYLIPFCFVLVNICDCVKNGQSDSGTAPKPGLKKTGTLSIINTSIRRAGSGFAKITANAVKVVAKAIKQRKFENQAGGHPDQIFILDEDVTDPDDNTKILIPAGALVKIIDEFEKLAIEIIKKDDELKGLVPEYYNMVVVPDLDKNKTQKKDKNGNLLYKTYLHMQNLTKGFDENTLVIVDIKFGWRSFLTNNPKDNDKDWMDKFIEFGLVESDHKGKCPKKCKHPHPPTKKVQDALAELRGEGIVISFPTIYSKIAGQKLKDQLNSQYHYGFRITATKLPNQKSVSDYNFLRKEGLILAKLNELLERCQPGGKALNLLVTKLEDALPHLIASDFFKHNEIPGSSGLILCDKDHMDLRFIDWGKTVALDPKHVDHVGMWVPGRQPKGDRADGYFTGIENLKKLLKTGKIKD